MRASRGELWFRLTSIRHDLIVRTEKPAIVHHFKDDRGDILSRIVGEGPIRLDPPGLTIEGLFDPLV